MAFDGIDPKKEKAIRRAITKEVRHQVAEEIRDNVRRRVESDIRAETRRQVLDEIEQRAPNDEDRATFQSYVREVRVDAEAQAHLASDIADAADNALSRSRRWGTPLAWLLTLAAAPIVAVAEQWGGLLSPTFAAVAATWAVVLLALLYTNGRRHRELRARSKLHRRIASDFLIIAERAKAYHMVHAERMTSSIELGEVLDELRTDKERCDRRFHPRADSLRSARESASIRIEEEDRRRMRIEVAADDEDSDSEAEAQAIEAKA